MDDMSPPPAGILRCRNNKHPQSNMLVDNESYVDLWADVAAESRKKSNRQDVTNQQDPNKCQHSDLRNSKTMSLHSKSHLDTRSAAHEARRRGSTIGMTHRRSASIDKSCSNGIHPSASRRLYNRPSRQQQQQQSQRRRHRAGQNHQSTGALRTTMHHEANKDRRHSSQFELNRGGSFRRREGQPKIISRPSNKKFSGSENALWCQHYEEEEEHGLLKMRNYDPRRADDRRQLYEEKKQGMQRMQGRSAHHAIEEGPGPPMTRQGRRSIPDLFKKQMNDSSHVNGNLQRRAVIACGMATQSRQSTKTTGPQISSTFRSFMRSSFPSKQFMPKILKT